MSLMAIRNKPFQLFVWLTCLLTFYLGFNQQVMCFELKPDGKVFKVHLQLIECNPLSAAIPAEHQTGMPMPGLMETGMSGGGCPECRDFHLSFKRTPSFDLSDSGAMTASFPFDYSVLVNKLFVSVSSRAEEIIRSAQISIPRSNSSLIALRTIILLI